MEINIGAKVLSSDHKEIGQADRLIVDPETGQVRELVIRKGIFLARDIVVPFYGVTKATQDEIYLNLTADEVQQLPDFIEDLYALPPTSSVPTGPYVLPGILYPQTYGYSMMPVTTAKRMEPGDVELTKGMEVLARDGKVGVVDEIITDPRNDRIAALVVRRGVLLTKDIVVPIRYVRQVGGGKVLLDLTKNELQMVARGKQLLGEAEQTEIPPSDEAKSA